MISVRQCLDRPQILSTDRHLMQGYLDLSDVSWDDEHGVLSGTSRVVAGDSYRVSLALNGRTPTELKCDDGNIKVELENSGTEICEFSLTGSRNGTVSWRISFKAER
jgi:hypothetical protein